MLKNIRRIISYISSFGSGGHAQARTSLDRHLAALEALNSGILDWDIIKRQVYGTQKAFDILDLSVESNWVNEQKILERLNESERDRLIRALNSPGNTKALQEIDTFSLDSQGNKIFIRFRGKIYSDINGNSQRFIGSISDVSQQKRLEQRLQHEALHDFLTGLPNRTLLVNRIQHILPRLKRNSEMKAALLFINIDNFKAVNNNLGRGFGDDLLVSVGEKLADIARASDTVSRMNGDVFVILLEDITVSLEAQLFANRILDKLQLPIRIQNRELNLSLSIGLVFIDDSYLSVESILGDAEIAMHAAKNSSKNQVVSFEHAMRTQAAKQLNIESALRQAIEKNELYLAYQAIFTLQAETPQAVGAEALLRWTQSEDVSIAPTELLDIAEQNGMIGAIGLWVIRTASSQLQKCLAEGYPKDFYININLSARHFDDFEIVAYLIEQMDSKRLPRNALRIEVVENAVIRNPDKALLVIERLKQEGISVSIDDFGTGFSSLSYLHRFPFYSLKIDRSFIEDLTANKATRDIVTAIIVMAGKLGIKVIAEGIETLDQLAFLKKTGCELGQGYLLAKPNVSASLDSFFLKQADEKPTLA